MVMLKMLHLALYAPTCCLIKCLVLVATRRGYLRTLRCCSRTSAISKGLAIHAELTGMSRRDWAAFREVLFLVRGNDGIVPRMILDLPKELST